MAPKFKCSEPIVIGCVLPAVMQPPAPVPVHDRQCRRLADTPLESADGTVTMVPTFGVEADPAPIDRG